ncbi:hypothetical protein MVLG_04964 [Microbotryum lychnidis-dioicae p1A1 Lamole]|uniref:Uncharacterized protein n=1 Tax=Microbotryum lychnidis-dioicae (strain p1A1 Lamole / MvSl-1064) TaxID=683840 RepID=U5HCT8_USTV1|nr:hypothetical protein MVLG_04964 [Microbotryum lychnidis-dioicae p1A1 Lamole]|eukprot:KDE04584.1 hypothetical protein MVLG_04964 [Microbotryum lychnidis-dioicae p1A1 Lamole]
MKLDDGKDDPEVNINATALREVKIEAAHVAMAKIEQRSNGAVTLTWPAVTTTIAELATSSIFEAGIAFGSQNENRVRLTVDIIESRYPALQMSPPTSLVVKQLLATKIANVARTSSTRATKRRKGLSDNVTASDSASAKRLEAVGDGTMTRNHDKAPSIMGSDATTSQVVDCEPPNHTGSEIGSPSPHSEAGLESILAAQHVVIASNSEHQTRREPIIARMPMSVSRVTRRPARKGGKEAASSVTHYTVQELSRLDFATIAASFDPPQTPTAKNRKAAAKELFPELAAQIDAYKAFVGKAD